MILKLSEDDPERELSFELDFLLSLSTRERFELMRERSEKIMLCLLRHGHREPAEIVERPRR